MIKTLAIGFAYVVCAFAFVSRENQKVFVTSCVLHLFLYSVTIFC